jgi:5'(3')-deoxyribonucleotidase
MKKLVYVDMDNVLVDFPSGVARLAAEVRAEFEGRLDEVPGIFALMPPMPGAIEGFAALAQRFDAYVLSTAPWENPSAWSDKLLWVKRHLGPPAYKRLILTHHKDLNAGDFLIDDRTKNGAERFRGEHIHFGTPRFPDWAAVLAYLLPRA